MHVSHGFIDSKLMLRRSPANASSSVSSIPTPMSSPWRGPREPPPPPKNDENKSLNDPNESNPGDQPCPERPSCP
jgi:hypothetical protein